MNKKTIITFSLVLITVIMASLVLFKKSITPSKTPVVVIGLDGADWNIIDILFKQNNLPHLKQLVKDGSSGIIETFRPTKSPVIWTSLATGKTMLKHGVLDWVYVKENDIQIPYSVDDIKVKAIWKILSENKLTTGVINWFCTFPAESINGYLVSDRYRISVDKYLEEKTVTFPSDLNSKIYSQVINVFDKSYSRILRKEKVKDYWSKSKTLKLDIPSGRKKQLKFFRRHFLQDKSIENISLYLLENIPVDFFAVYFRLIDTTSHFASLFLDIELREKWIQENKSYGGPSQETGKQLYRNMTAIMKPVYIYLDNVIGRIMEKAQQDSTFIIVSDHGFNFSTSGYSHYKTPVIPHGIIVLKGPKIKNGYKLKKAHIFDVTPTILHLFNLPVAKDMDGKVLQECFIAKAQKKIKYIPSYESTPHVKNAKDKKALDKEVLEDLKSLGYIK